jgi:hypothetical protein
MFGNGSDPQLPQTVEPPSSASLWGDMFGIGSLLKTMSDPALGANINAMLLSVIEASKSSARVEAKLDQLLKALADGNGNAALSLANGTDGSGRPSAPSGALDDGSSFTANADRKPRSDSCAND